VDCERPGTLSYSHTSLIVHYVTYISSQHLNNSVAIQILANMLTKRRQQERRR
jgi:hypothetical protein